MAVSVVKPQSGSGRSGDVWGRHKVHLRQITFDNSYPTGGEALSLEGIGDPTTAIYIFQQRAPLTGAYQFVYDRTNGKLLVFWVDTTVDGKEMLEVANTTDLSALVVDLLVIEV